MNIMLQLGLSLTGVLVLVGNAALLMGVAKRRLNGTAEVIAQLDADMIDIDHASVTVSENQRVALALSPDHRRMYLVHTLGDKLVTRHLDPRGVRVEPVREGMRVLIADAGATSQLVHLPTANVRIWSNIFDVLRNGAPHGPA